MALTPRQQRAIAGWRDELGRWYAGKLGLHGNKGGWLVSHVNRKPVVQGYRGLYHKFHRTIWTAIEFNQESN